MDATRERTLLEEWSRGDRSAAERLLEESYRQTYAALFRLTGGREELAADLTQETYRKAWRSLGSFDRRSRFGTWLYRIAYNTFLNHLRRPRLVESEADPPEATDPEPGPEERAARGQIDERLRRAVAALPDPLRYTVTAHFWGGLATREIALQEGVTGAAIRKRIRQAVQRLRSELEEAAR